MYKNRILLNFVVPVVVAVFSFYSAKAQQMQFEDLLLKIYRGTDPKINDLVHTKLNVSFDYKRHYLYGKEWLTLMPHAYPTDTLRLNARGMNINSVSLIKNGIYLPLIFKYDSLTLAIQLNRVYRESEHYQIYIDYTAKPDELPEHTASVFNNTKGLYFINPDGRDKTKPVQIWTQGEQESSSAWFPTIDRPDQKTTSEINMRVLSKYVTLSNGRLSAQNINRDGTRTDTWIMNKPHSPYLFMMAVGQFSIYRDKWRNKEVNYYTEPGYAAYAKDIFGLTPEIMEFYSRKLGVDYPWNKYAQIVVRDYSGGSMENTTATLHSEGMQQSARELLDSYYDENQQKIAHELFHQWFGDYVTCESWSNLTLNESFADFSEMLWAEHKYGKDKADALKQDYLERYLNSEDAAKKDLVRFYYKDKIDMADVVTYQKGGHILTLLRNYLGDEAFFKGLHIYLSDNAFKSAEVQQLRLAFELASGLDLNWFFDQWYFGSGHPVINISYKWDPAKNTGTVFILQTQFGRTFRLPMAIDIYSDCKKIGYKFELRGRETTLTYHLTAKPDLVNLDADKIFLGAKNDNKNLTEYEYQYFNAPLYLDRLEAIEAAGKNKSDSAAQRILIAALSDKYYGLRIMAIKLIGLPDKNVSKTALHTIEKLATKDQNTLVRAAAISSLGKLKSAGYDSLFHHSIQDRSYAIQAAALIAISQTDPSHALTLAKVFEHDHKGALSSAIFLVYGTCGSDIQWNYVLKEFERAYTVQEKMTLIKGFSAIAGRVANPASAQTAIRMIRDIGIQYKSNGAAPSMINYLTQIKMKRAVLNDSNSVKSAADAIQLINDSK